MSADVPSDSIYEEELRVAETAYIAEYIAWWRTVLDEQCRLDGKTRKVTPARVVSELCQLWSPSVEPAREPLATAAHAAELAAILSIAELCIQFGRSELNAYVSLLLRTIGQSSRCMDLLLEHLNETLCRILDRKWQLAIGRIEEASGRHIVSGEHWSSVEQELRRYALEYLNVRVFLTSGTAPTVPVRRNEDPFDTVSKRRAAIAQYKAKLNLSSVEKVADHLSVDVKNLHAWARDRSKNRARIEPNIVKGSGNQLPTQ